MEIETIRPIINSVIEANRLMKKHAEERLDVLSELFMNLDNIADEMGGEFVEKILQEIHEIHMNISSPSDVESLEMELLQGQNKKLKTINKIMGELDIIENNLHKKQQKLSNINKSLMERDELINILEEYVELETASNYKILTEISDLENIKFNFEKSMNVYSLLSRYDPRIQALSILEKNPQGISKYQLITMLDISNYEAKKIVDELIEMKMVETRGNDSILSLPGETVNLQLIEHMRN